MRTAPLFAALMLVPAAALAQSQHTDRLVPGAWSLAFALPSGGGGAIGAWKMISPRANLGVTVSLNYQLSQNRYSDSLAPNPSVTSAAWTVGLTPSLKLYRRLRPNVAPYLLAAFNVGYHWYGNTERTRDYSLSLGPSFGFGLEWFPLADVSIDGSASLGVSAQFSRESEDYGTIRTRSIGTATATSALALHVYM